MSNLPDTFSSLDVEQNVSYTGNGIKGDNMTRHDGKYVAYYRVSTGKQAKSGLGLEAQQAAVRTHLNGGRWKLVAELQEVETGKRKDRPVLAEAIATCKVHNAALLIAKLDRL